MLVCRDLCGLGQCLQGIRAAANAFLIEAGIPYTSDEAFSNVFFYCSYFLH